MPDFEEVVYDNVGDEPGTASTAGLCGGDEGPRYDSVVNHASASQGYLQVGGMGGEAALQVIELDAYANDDDDLYDAIA